MTEFFSPKKPKKIDPQIAIDKASADAKKAEETKRKSSAQFLERTRNLGQVQLQSPNRRPASGTRNPFA